VSLLDIFIEEGREEEKNARHDPKKENTRC
jgi:hypothetical protein